VDTNGVVFEVNEEQLAVAADIENFLANGRTRGRGSAANQGISSNHCNGGANGWEQDRAIRRYLKEFWHVSTLGVTQALARLEG